MARTGLARRFLSADQRILSGRPRVKPRRLRERLALASLTVCKVGSTLKPQISGLRDETSE